MIKYLQNETKRRLNKEFLFDFEAGSGSYTFKYFIIFGIFRRKMTQNFVVIEIKKVDFKTSIIDINLPDI